MDNKARYSLYIIGGGFVGYQGYKLVTGDGGIGFVITGVFFIIIGVVIAIYGLKKRTSIDSTETQKDEKKIPEEETVMEEMNLEENDSDWEADGNSREENGGN